MLDLEAALGTRYTADFLDRLLAMRRRARFLWIAGADLMGEWRRWRRCEDVLGRIPLAVFARPSYFRGGLHGWFATRYRDGQVMAAASRSLISTPPPAWTFLRCALPRVSATALRARLGERWWEAIGAPNEEAS